MSDIAARTSRPIKFSQPVLGLAEFNYVREAMEGDHIHGDGPFTDRCAELLETMLGCARVLLTPSCTHALELAVMLLGLEPGDEVIVPSFTFPSTATAIVRAGARPVFVDIRRDTLNIDEAQIEEAITPRTRALLPVHYNGVGCEMDSLRALSEKYDLRIIEDNAQGLFGRYGGVPLGTLGELGCLSFHATKNFTCGEGGALLINDPGLIDLAEIMREKGTNRRAFFEGRVDKYTWVNSGSSFLPSDILAAMLLAQLESRQTIQERRRVIWETYLERLAPLTALGVLLPSVPLHCEQTYHLFYLITRSVEERQSLGRYMRLRDTVCTSHYQPLHNSEAGKRFGTSVSGCPVSIEVSERLIRLPLHIGIDIDQAEQVADFVLEFFRRNHV